MDSVVDSPVEALQADAVRRARAAVGKLESLGVRVLITGSLAKGSFGLHSDVDFLVTSCPRPLKYAIEGHVEDAMGPFRFDVIYLEEIPASMLSGFTDCAIDVSGLP
jgi:predicted nucleotidyltransferase